LDKPSEPRPPSQLRRFPLRWLGSYLLLWFMPAPLSELPWIGPYLSGPIGNAKAQIAQWLSRGWLGGEGVAYGNSGGSDRTIDYYIAAWLLVASFAIAVSLSVTRGWSAARERRAFDWLGTYLRLMLACTMMLYGLCKIFPLQFHMAGPRVLTMRVGDLERWEVMWLFMGVSLPYTMLAGLAEIFGGVLLMWKRTSLLGALLLLIVMGNVALMGFCYDVDMKVFACHLVLAILMVIAPDAPRLMRALLRTETESRSGAGWLHRAGRVAPFAIFVLVSAQTLHWAWTLTHAQPGPHPLHGIWTVDADGGASITPKSVHTVAIQRGSFTTVDRVHSRKLYKIDPEKQSADRLTLMDATTGQPVGTLRASAKGQTKLLLAGELAGEPLELALRRSEDTQLESQRFHWTRDRPPEPR
jgi:hypothetical protein